MIQPTFPQVPVIKKYNALITEPTIGTINASILHNKLGTIDWVKLSTGVYEAQSAGLFIIGKTILPPFAGATPSGRMSAIVTLAGGYHIVHNTVNSILLKTYSAATGSTPRDLNTIGGQIFVEILVYTT